MGKTVGLTFKPKKGENPKKPDEQKDKKPET